jgi:DNA-binding response OmpR family regulator
MSESSAYQDLNSRQDTAEPPMGAISFGPFRLIASQRLLLKEDKPVQLGGRALDILIALTAKAGQPVTKDELITIVWGRRSGRRLQPQGEHLNAAKSTRRW